MARQEKQFMASLVVQVSWVFDSTLDEIKVNGKNPLDMCTSAPDNGITGFVAVNQCSPQ